MRDLIQQQVRAFMLNRLAIEIPGGWLYCHPDDRIATLLYAREQWDRWFADRGCRWAGPYRDAKEGGR